MIFNNYYHNENTLIIGCGNKYKNHYKIHPINSFTIDENKNIKPSLVCSFGKYDIPLPNNSFSTIIFEGLFPFAINTYKGINELKRISQDNIHIIVTIIENNKTIILAERLYLKSKYISSFLLCQLTEESKNKLKVLI